MVAVALLILDIAGIILPFTDIGSPERVIELCRLTSFLVPVGEAAQFLFLSAFSVTVFIIMTCHMPSSRESHQCVFYRICRHNHNSVVYGYPEWLACSV